MPTSIEGTRGTLTPTKSRSYWRANIRVMTTLLIVWAFVAYGLGIVWVEELNNYSIWGFPLGFWVGHQGAMYVFVVLVFIYALWMDHLDRFYGVD